jgi:hypothetical protein
MVGPWCTYRWQDPMSAFAFTFIARLGFSTLTLAHMLDSLVRVSRRVGNSHFVSIQDAPYRERYPAAATAQILNNLRKRSRSHLPARPSPQSIPQFTQRGYNSRTPYDARLTFLPAFSCEAPN